MMTEDEIKNQIELLKQQKDQLLAQLNITEGALQAYQFVLNPPQPPAPPPAPQP